MSREATPSSLASSVTTAARSVPPPVGHDLWERPVFDRQLILKYDRPGPRYTSYPTAPWFQEGFGAEGYQRLLAASAESRVPLSLYVHVPFCETRCFFCGCNVAISRNHERGARYLDTLIHEIDLVAERLAVEDRQLAQLHWGGGTPNFLRPEELERLGRRFVEAFPLHPDFEFGVEVDPRRCSEEHLDALSAVGVNRLSVGVQDVDPRVQEAINRVQPQELTRAVVEGARRRGIDSINVDLIYGLPHQTPDSFAATVAEVSTLEPDRFAIFNFAYLPEMIPHQRVIVPEELPPPEDKLTILEQVVERLVEVGYVFIGMDHFAKPRDPLAQALRDRTLTRNFQGYSTWGGCDLVGFGSSAIGQLAGGYAQNLKEVTAYQSRVDGGELATEKGLVLSPEDELRRDVIVGLMCQFRLDKGAVESAHDIDFDVHFAGELASLAPMIEDGLVELSSEAIEVTPLGRLLVRNVAMAFDAYLGREQRTYSRTV